VKRLAMLAAAAAAATVVVALVASAGSAQQGGPGKGQERTIVLTERDEGTFRFIDNPPRHRVNRRGEPRRLTTGDEFLGSSPVYDAANSNRLGTFYFHCAVVFARRTFERSRFLCEGTFRLSDGTMTAQATFQGSEATVTAAVTGGTGNYEGASGTLTSVDQRNTTKDTIHLVR
jgi:hypothetical protein